MASIGKITINVRDELIHDALKDFAEKVYKETGVKIECVAFNWYSTGFGNENCLLQVKIDSSK